MSLKKLLNYADKFLGLSDHIDQYRTVKPLKPITPKPDPVDIVPRRRYKSWNELPDPLELQITPAPISHCDDCDFVDCDGDCCNISDAATVSWKSQNKAPDSDEGQEVLSEVIELESSDQGSGSPAYEEWFDERFDHGNFYTEEALRDSFEAGMRYAEEEDREEVQQLVSRLNQLQDRIDLAKARVKKTTNRSFNDVGTATAAFTVMAYEVLDILKGKVTT